MENTKALDGDECVNGWMDDASASYVPSQARLGSPSRIYSSRFLFSFASFRVRLFPFVLFPRLVADRGSRDTYLVESFF